LSDNDKAVTLHASVKLAEPGPEEAPDHQHKSGHKGSSSQQPIGFSGFTGERRAE